MSPVKPAESEAILLLLHSCSGAWLQWAVLWMCREVQVDHPPSTPCHFHLN